MHKSLPAIPVPHEIGGVPAGLRSLYEAVRAMKFTLDALTGRATRSDPLYTVVTWHDLVEAGLLTEEEARKVIGEH